MEQNIRGALAAGLRSLLDLAVSRNEVSLLDDVEQSLNVNLPAARICLSQFWEEVSPGNEKDVCVPPAYTARGYDVMDDALADILTISGNNDNMRQNLNAFLERKRQREKERHG